MAPRRARRRPIYVAKIDLANCYWSIRMPRDWGCLFVVEVGGRRYRITRLPFGWKYSPSICQRLVRLAVGGRTLAWADLDGILAADIPKQRLRSTVRRNAKVLTLAGLIISPKSVMQPKRELDFVVQQLMPKRCGLAAQKQGTLAAALCAWLKALSRRWLATQTALSTLGKVNWVVRPRGGVGPFLTGA